MKTAITATVKTGNRSHRKSLLREIRQGNTTLALIVVCIAVRKSYQLAVKSRTKDGDRITPIKTFRTQVQAVLFGKRKTGTTPRAVKS